MPKWTGGADWAEGLDGLPPLGGYIATTAKERAELVIVSPIPDPIAARWSYGLGRSVAWTSDVSGNWSSKWVNWPSFSQFVNRMVSWTFPHYDQGDWLVETSQTDGRGYITLSLGDGADPPEGEFDVTVVRDDLSKETVPLKAVAPGTYRAEFAADEPGAYMLQISEIVGETVLRSETYGMAVPYSPEYRLPQNGGENLRAIAQAGMGDVLSEPRQAFTDIPGRHWERQPISRWCLLLAMLLLPLDIAARRLTIALPFTTRIRNRVTRTSRVPKRTAYTETLTRLNRRKGNRLSRRPFPEKSPSAGSPSGAAALERERDMADERPKRTRDAAAQPGQTTPTPTKSRRSLEKKEIGTAERMERLLAAKNRRKR